MLNILDIIYEDENIVVVNKPAGMLAHSDKKNKEETLADLLAAKYPEIKTVGGELRPGIVHRLDKDVSGLLVAAKNQKALEILQKRFQQGKVVKKYLALAEGKIAQKKGIIRTFVGKDKAAPIRQLAVRKEGIGKIINPKEAITRYLVLKRFRDQEGRDLTFLEVEPETGRTHQIRIHFQYLRHPIIGDKKYGSKISFDSRIFLHAAYLKIKLPNGTIKEFNSSLPAELEAFLNGLSLIS